MARPNKREEALNAVVSIIEREGITALTLDAVGGLRANGTKTYAKKLIHCLN